MTGWPPLDPDGEAGETIRIHPSPAQPRQRSVAPLFMITVMVVTVVVGAVAVIYLLTGDRGARPGPAAAAGAPSSAAPSASSAVDRCVVGEWQATSMKVADPEGTVSLSTDNGGTLRLGADGTGGIDFGSGVTLKGKIDGVTSDVMYIGRAAFHYTTANGTFTYSELRIDARVVVFQSGRIVSNERVPADDWDPEKYTCTGDAMQVVSDGAQDDYRRR